MFARPLGALAIAAAAFALAGASASAQSLPLVGPPNGIAVGVFNPSSSSAKAAGNSQFTAELRYGLPGVPLTPTRTVLSAGYEGGSKNGVSSTIIPLTIGEYTGSGNANPFGAGQLYFGAGTGAYIVNQTGKSNKVSFGGFVGAGYNISLLFAEARYQFAPNANGFLFNLGLRF